MALAQIVPILITLQGDNSSTVFTYSLPNIYQAAPGGSIPFGTNGVVPSSVVINNPPYTVTSSTVDANGNITITFTSAPPALQFSIEVDLVYNSGRASSSSSTFSENVVITGGTVVATQGTAANLNATVVFPSAQHVIVDSGGGGGTQYITGTAETTPTGTMALGWDGTTVKALPLDGSGYLKVNVAAGSSGNAAAGATGSPVPTSASYTGYNVSGNLVGVSALDPLPVTVENSSIAVTGAFWQVTQPISGTVAVSGSVAVTGTFWQATQPVSGTVTANAGTGNFTVVQSSGSNLHVDVDNSVAVTGTFWQTTQPISGTVAVSGTVVVSNSALSELTFTNYGSPAHECLNVYVINPLTATLTETQIGVTQVTSPWVTDIWTNAGNTISSVSPFLQTGIFDANGTTVGANVITAGARAGTTYNSLAVGVVGLSGNIVDLTDDGSGNLNTSVSSVQGVVEISANFVPNSKTNPIFMEIADGTHSSALTAFGTAPATSTYALGTNSQLVALVSSTPTALTATGTSLNVNITGGSSGNAAASATGSAVPADASYTGFNSGGNLVGVSSSNPLPITVENSSIAVTGTFYQTTQPISGTVTANAGTGTFNIQSNASVNLTQLNGSALGAPSNYGTSPGAVAVQGVNAYVTNTIPVTLTSTTITGTVSVTQSTSPWIIAGGGTAGSPGTAVLTVQGIGGGTAIPVSGTFWQATQPVSGTVAVSSVSGSVAVTGTFWQATQPVSGTFWQATQPVSGTVGVSGTVAVTQSTSPWVVSNPVLSEITFSSYGSPATENLNVYVVNPITATFTETQIGVTQVTSPWVVSNSGTFAVQDSTSEGYLSTLAGTVSSSKVQVNVTNTTLTVVGDAASGSAVAGNPVLTGGSDGTDARTFLTSNTGQLHVIADTGSTTAVTQGTAANLNATVIGTGTFAVQAACTQTTSPWIVAGGGTAGSPGSAVLTVQGIGSGTALPVSGTFWQTTQPVSGTVAVSSVSGSVAVTGTFWQTTQPVSGTFWQSTQPVSGTVAVSSVGGSVAVTGTFWPYSLGQQLAAASVPIVLTAAQLTTLTPPAAITNYALETGGNLNAIKTDADTIAGAVSASKMNINISSGSIANTSFIATQATGTNLHTVVDSGSITVSGTVSVSNSFALDSSVNGILVAQASTTSGQSGPLVQSATTTNAPTYVTAKTNPLSSDTSGNLRVSLKDTPSNTNNFNVNLAASAATVTVSGTVAATQSGTWNIGTVTTVTAVTAITNALPAGSNVIGHVISDSGSTTAVTGTVTVAGNKTNNNAAPGATNVGTLPALANAAAPSWTEGNQVTLSTDLSGNLRVTGGGGGSQFAMGSAQSSSALGTVVLGYDGTNVRGLLTSSTGQLHSIIDSATLGTVTVSGTVTTTPPSHASTNVDQWNGNTVDTNSGNKSAGTLRVTLATDQVQLTNALKVDGSGVTQPVSGTFWQSTQPVSIAATVNVADANLELAQGSTTSGQVGPLVQGAVTTSAPTYTTGKTDPLSLTPAGALRVDGSGVTQPVSGTVSISGTVAATQSGTWNIGTVTTVTAVTAITNALPAGSNVIGHVITDSGSVTTATTNADAAIAAGSAPSKALVTGGVFNSSAPAPTNGQTMAQQFDQAGNIRTFNGAVSVTLAAQSGTLNATQSIISNSGAEAVLVQLTQTTTITAGAVTFEFTYDGSNWAACPANCVVDPTSATFAQISIPYTCQASTNKQFLILMNGAQGLRIRTSTAITGTGTVTPNYTLVNFNPLPSVVALSPTAANFLVTTTPPSHASTNVDQLNGTTTDTNSGSKSAGTLRVVIATDQPQLTNKLLVTPDSVALPANQSVNISQINAVTPLMGNGTTGTGSQRVTIASDNTAFAVNATLSAETTKVIGTVRVLGNVGGVFDAATNAAPPANAVQVGYVAATALPTAFTATDLVPPMADKYGRQVVLPQAMRDIVGTKWTQIASSSAETTIVASVSSVFLDITGIQITNQSATAVTVTIKDSTGGTTRKTYDLAANGGIVVHFSPPLPQNAVTNNWTATLSSAAVTVDINVDYIQNK